MRLTIKVNYCTTQTLSYALFKHFLSHQHLLHHPCLKIVSSGKVGVGLPGCPSGSGKLLYLLLSDFKQLLRQKIRRHIQRKGIWHLPLRLFIPSSWQSFLHPALPSLLPVNGLGQDLQTQRDLALSLVLGQASPPCLGAQACPGQPSTIKGSDPTRFFLPPSTDLFAQNSYGQEI